MDEKIIELIITLILAVLSIFVIPYLKQKVGQDKYEQLISFIEWCVRWAEQKYTPEENHQKKIAVYERVSDYAEEIGIKVTPTQLDSLIEGVVHLVKTPDNN